MLRCDLRGHFRTHVVSVPIGESNQQIAFALYRVLQEDSQWPDEARNGPVAQTASVGSVQHNTPVDPVSSRVIDPVASRIDAPLATDEKSGVQGSLTNIATSSPASHALTNIMKAYTSETQKYS